jgi:hypothetical protein
MANAIPKPDFVWERPIQISFNREYWDNVKAGKVDHEQVVWDFHVEKLGEDWARKVLEGG